MNNAFLFSELKVGQYFRIPGYDSLMQKETVCRARNCGTAYLKKPIRFGRTGSLTKMEKDIFVSVVQMW